MAHIASDGPEKSLTGPVERNDEETIQKHLQCLETAEDRQLYRLLSRRITGLAQQQASGEGLYRDPAAAEKGWIKMKNTVLSLMKMKESREKISMLTCYDYSTARLMESSGINMILVGDSLGNTMLGYPDTLSVTMEDMIHHGAAVVRGVQ